MELKHSEAKLIRHETPDWPSMNDEELHEFGIDLIIPFLSKEGVTIDVINRDLKPSLKFELNPVPAINGL